MASLFLSHSSQDNALVGQVVARLKAEGYPSQFLDFDPEQGIPAGLDWERYLYARLKACDAVIALVTPASVASRWCFAEIAFARALGKPVIPLNAGARHPLLDRTQRIDLTAGDEQAYPRLWQALKTAGLDPGDAFDLDPQRPPYPGLEAFDLRDAALFFGREGEIEVILERLRRSWERGEGRSLAVVGPSGSGKSSLVNAGVLPRLLRLQGRWCILPIMRPGADPLFNLALSFAGAFKRLGQPPPADLEARLRGDPDGLVKALLLGDPGEAAAALLVMDQFEEIFTRASEAERQGLFDILRQALEAGSRLWLLFSLRSEELGAALRHPFAAGLLAEPVVVASLDRNRLPRVIEGPAERYGMSFDPGLVERMVEETGGGDALPLLAYTLRQLYERAGPDRRITQQSYDEMGGVGGALERQANRALQALEGSHGASVRALALETLSRLAVLNTQGQPARRPLARSRLSPLENEILDEFIEGRLLVAGSEHDEPVVEVAHEALLRQWPPLRQTLEAHAGALRWWAELERAAAEWERAGRASGYLWPGERLASGQSWLSAEPERAEDSALLAAFIAASQERDRTMMSSRANALATAILQNFEEDPERAMLLALEGLATYIPTPRLRLALNTAFAANRLHGRVTAETSITAAALSPDGRLTAIAERGVPPKLSPISQPWREESQPRLVCPLRVWDAETGEKRFETGAHSRPVVLLQFAPDGERLLAIQEDGLARLWSAQTGALVAELEAVELPAKDAGGHLDFSAVFTADSREVLVCPTGGAAQVYATGTGARLQPTPLNRPLEILDAAIAGEEDLEFGYGEDELPGHNNILVKENGGWSTDPYLLSGLLLEPDILALSPGGGICLRKDPSELVTQRNIVRPEWQAIKIIQKRLNNLIKGYPLGKTNAFSADGVYVATVLTDETRSPSFSASGPGEIVACVWEAAQGKEVARLRGHAQQILAAGLSRDAALLLTATQQEARLWDILRPAYPLWLRHSTPVEGGYNQIMFSRDGDYLLLVSQSGQTAVLRRSLEGEARAPLLQLPFPCQEVFFSADRRRILLRGQILRAVDAASAETLYEAPVENGTSADLSPDGSRLVIALGYRLLAGETQPGSSLHDVQNSTLPGEGELDRYRGVRFSPDGQYFAAGTAGGKAAVWEAGTEVRRLEILGEQVVFSPGGEILAGIYFNRVQVADLKSGRVVSEFDAGGSVVSCDFSPDGSQLLCAGRDGSLRLWDVASGEMILMLIGSQDPPIAAAFAPDGKRFAALSTAGFLSIWENPSLEELVDRVRGLPLRQLTAEERQRYGLTG